MGKWNYTFYKILTLNQVWYNFNFNQTVINLRVHILIPRQKTFLEIQKCISYKASREYRVKYLKILYQLKRRQKKIRKRTERRKLLNKK